MAKRSNSKSSNSGHSVSTSKDVKAFRQAAKHYAASATTSKKAATDKLIKLGIYTKSGKLAKKYR